MNGKQVKLLPKKLYLKGSILVKVVSTNARENRVIIYRYDSFETEHMEYDTAPYKLEPVFKIGEVAKFLQRSVDTIRKYEQLGLIPPAAKFKVARGGQRIRVYTEKDLFELADFFALREPPGRPTSKVKASKIDRVHMLDNLKSRYEREWK